MADSARRPTRIAVLSVSAGAGHLRAAQAIEAAGALRDDVEVIHLDVMELVDRFFRKAYADGYLRLVDKHPQLWGSFYRTTDRRFADVTINRFLRGVERFAARKLKSWLRRHDPDHVICTHFLPGQFLSRMRGRGTWHTPVWIAVTDFDCHTYWINNHIDGYLVASDEVAWRMRFRGVPQSTIHITGIPIMPDFSVALTRAQAARRHGLDPDRFTLVVMSGGHGLSNLLDQVEHLLDLPGDYQVAALAGRNQQLFKRLHALAAESPRPLIPIAYTTDMPALLRAADVAITKPGGLTSSECLACGLPMIVVSPIPGQEERNADYLLEQGIALKAIDSATLAYRVQVLLNDRMRLNRMAANASRIARPDAADRVIDTVLGSHGARPAYALAV